MSDNASGNLHQYTAEDLVDLTEALREWLVDRTLLLALLLSFAAAPLILAANVDVRSRLVLLTAVAVLCGLASSHSRRCYETARDSPWTVLPVALAAAVVLAVGNGRQNPTFVVIVAVLVGVPVAAGLRAGLGAGLIVGGGYLLGIVARGQPLLVGGSPGDVAAIASSLVAICAAHWSAGLASLMVADLNREARVAAELTSELDRSVRQDHAEQRGGADGGRGAATYGRSADPSDTPVDTERPSVAARQDVNGPTIRQLREEQLSRVTAEEMQTGHDPQADASLPPRLAAYGVTFAEAQVAVLSAGGATHQEIADRLGKSPKTVEHQLASVRRKLDVSTPSAMAVLVRRSVDLPPRQSPGDQF